MPRCKKPAEGNKDETKAEVVTTTPAAKAKKTPLKTGTKLTCPDCGLVVIVDEACTCEDTCDLICCGKPLKVKK